MSGERKTIVALDDSEVVLDVMRLVLEANGHVVYTATTLTHLEAHLARVRPDLVILDVQMPEAFGDDVGRALATMHGMRAPILLFSSLSKRELERRVREADLAGFVSKDDGIEALAERVDALLRA